MNTKLLPVCPLSESKSEGIPGVTVLLRISSRRADTACVLGCLRCYQKNEPGVKRNPYIK